MPYLETEEEAAERIADIHKSRDDTRKKEEKHTNSSDLESEESESSDDIKYKKIDMDDIDNLYKDISESSFNYVTIYGRKYTIKKVLKFLKNIKNGHYNENKIIKFYIKDGIDEIEEALIRVKKRE